MKLICNKYKRWRIINVEPDLASKLDYIRGEIRNNRTCILNLPDYEAMSSW